MLIAIPRKHPCGIAARGSVGRGTRTEDNPDGQAGSPCCSRSAPTPQAASASLRYDRQNDAGWVSAVVQDGLLRLARLGSRAKGRAGVRIPIEAREVAARDLDAYAVPGQEYIPGRPDV